MTQHEKKNEKKKEDEITQEIIEESSLEKIQQETEKIALQKEIDSLTREMKNMGEVAKKAQYDYINLKMDFDHFKERTENRQKENEVQMLIDVVKKFLPLIEDVRKSIGTIPENMKEEPLSKGIVMTYNKFIQTLQNMHIQKIESIGLEPNGELHEPVQAQPTTDEKMKGKIVQELSAGFVYEKDGIKKVITTSKVIIAQ